MAIESAHLVPITGTATALNETTNDGLTIVVKNTGLQPIDLGPSSVEGGAGFTLAPGEILPAIYVQADEQLFAIRSGLTNSSVDVLRMGV